MFNMIKAVISGATGKMGRKVHSVISTRRDIMTIAGIDALTQKSYDTFPIVKEPGLLTEKPDVIIDFSHPLMLDSILGYCLTTNTPLVAATTGYTSEQTAKIKKAAEIIPLFFSFNMSLGINLLVNLSQKAAEVLGMDFDIEIIEKHHNLKIDSPSGTAIMLADTLNEARGGNMQNVYDRYAKRKKRADNEIGISAVRGGTIVGEHEVMFCGRDEIITLSHGAYSKEVFAVGAVNAAIFIADKPAGLYDMTKLIEAR
jgi:4-hydroxy-tetrahydrodipicolinate reductase